MSELLSPAEFMDRQYPGWEEKIDFPTLRMWDPTGCIIGQASGGRCDMSWSRCMSAAYGVADFITFLYEGVLLAPFAGGDNDPHNALRMQYWREEVAKRKLAKRSAKRSAEHSVETPEPNREPVLV